MGAVDQVQGRSGGLTFRGCALVRRNGAEVLRYAGGTNGPDGAEALTTATRFQLASVSKQCTAAAVLTLVDRGELGLDTGLNSIVPDGPSSWDEITMHHLLTHTAGLVHWRDLPDLDLCATDVTADALLERFRRAPLLTAPGTTYSYSSPGYVLLAHVVERVSTTPYRAFCDRELFANASMASTFAGNGTGAGLAVPMHDGRQVASFELDVIGMGAGDVWSTVDDQAAWDVALRDGRVLSERTTSAMLTAYAPVPDRVEGLEIDGYGYGLCVGSIAGRPLVFHTGDNAGFLALNAWFADADTQVVVLTNDTTSDIVTIGMQVLGVALDA